MLYSLLQFGFLFVWVFFVNCRVVDNCCIAFCISVNFLYGKVKASLHTFYDIKIKVIEVGRNSDILLFVMKLRPL